tara:strand:- start:917 stop:1669 length:753 start_codon:yes stop_codon:yes gene_type:complete
MKTLYLDFENGYKSLGSKEEVAEIFGLPMIQYDSYKDFKALLGKIYTRTNVETEIDVGGIPISQKIIKWVPNEKVTIDAIVIDTMTEMVKQYQRDLAGDKKRLQLQQWGEMKTELDVLMSVVNSIPTSLICNVHGKLKEDNELNVLKVMPNIEGSTKEDLGKWFDFVLYTQVNKDDKGNRKYQWVTARDEKYCHAKDRSQELQPVMDQDYSVIFNIVKKKGWDGAKILVIGDPGSGKTMSLKTINNKGAK